MAPVTDQKQPNENGNSSLVEFCSLTCFNRYAMKQEIKKNIFGIYEVMYDCPKCSLRLTSQLLEAGDVDQCPNCGTKFRIPGKQQRAAYESKLAADQAAKEAEKKLREEERRIAAEEKRLQQEESRLQQEEQRRTREIIVRQDKDRRRGEHLVPPTIFGHLETSQGRCGELSDSAECPFCAEFVSSRARKCKHCGELLDPVLRAVAENRRATAVPQIVNVVQANASASAAASTSPALGCGGCISAVILLMIIIVCAGLL